MVTQNIGVQKPAASHGSSTPSRWVCRWAPLVRPGGRVLDLAAGLGRHTRLFAGRGHPVLAVDRNAEAIGALRGLPGVVAMEADLEGGPWPFAAERFAAVVVTNYLHRPLFEPIAQVLEEPGVLIYETFAQGNEVYGRPSNPDFLLRPGELLEAFAGRLQVVAYESGLERQPKLAVVQRLCAARTREIVALAAEWACGVTGATTR